MVSANATAAAEVDYTTDETLHDWQTNASFFETTAMLEPAQLELAIRQRISYIEEAVQKQRDRLNELEANCAQAESAGDDAVYAMFEAQWEQVDENIAMMEGELSACNQIIQEKYYQ